MKQGGKIGVECSGIGIKAVGGGAKFGETFDEKGVRCGEICGDGEGGERLAGGSQKFE